MKRPILLVTVLLFSLVTYAHGESVAMQEERLPSHFRQEYVPGEVLVKYKTGTSTPGLRAIRNNPGLRTVKVFQSIDAHHVKLPSNMTVEKALELYRTDPNVEYAEPNYLRYSHAKIPDDTDFGQLWGLHNTGQEVNGVTGTLDADIDSPEAWEATTSSGVIIAMLDGGADYNHPDLSGNIWLNTGELANNGIDDDGNGYIDDIRGWDFHDSDNDPIDADGHGTHVAGTIAALGNNGLGITGVCWTAEIMVLKAGNALGEFSTSTIISAIDYAMEKGAKVINASFSGLSSSSFELAAISRANDAGILFVAAAGNSGSDNDLLPEYPASYDLDNIISVAGIDQDGLLSAISNYGFTSVDVAAPGENILSTQPAREGLWSDNFDDNDISDWTTGGINNTWGLTDSQSFSGSRSLTDSPSSFYQNNSASWAMAPVFDFSSYHGTKLEFVLEGSSRFNQDILTIQTSIDGTNWTDEEVLTHGSVLSGISGTLSWTSVTVDLGAYDGKTTVYIRFLFTTDSAETSSGWFIDDVTITVASSSYSGVEYQYMDGTSMATPHVAGLAGLIWSINPNFNITQVKDIILSNVDSNPSLEGRTVSGGRINSMFAVNAAIATPTSDDEGSCFIATAAFGSYSNAHVRTLRNFRDIYLSQNKFGQAFLSLYYKYSPPMAHYIRKHNRARTVVRIGLLPLVWTAEFFLKTTFVYNIILMILLLVFTCGAIIWDRQKKEKTC